MGDFLEEIFAFPFIIYSFMFLIPLSNTPQIFLVQILDMSPIIVSLPRADLLRTFFWQLFVLFLFWAVPIENNLWAWTCWGPVILGHCFLFFTNLNKHTCFWLVWTQTSGKVWYPRNSRFWCVSVGDIAA